LRVDRSRSERHHRGPLFSDALRLVLFEPIFEECDGGAEVVTEGDEQIDVVEVVVAIEAVGEVIAWVDGGPHVAAAGAEEAEVAVAPLGGRALAAEQGDGDGHR
jgi:hypothetical protein